MIETTWANHYKIGYNNEWFTFRKSAEDRLDIFTDGCSREPMAFALEAVNTASIIADKRGKENIALFYSGGGDSEIILQSFIGAGKIPGRIIFLDYGSNDYDRFHATNYAKYFGIKLEIMKIDAEEMLTSGESLDICSRYQCGQVGLSFYMKAIEEVCKTHYVITGDEPYMERLDNPIDGTSDWYFYAREPFYSLWKVFIKNGADGCPNFIQYTPELWLSFMEDPLMKWLRSDQNTELSNSNQIKPDVYRHRFFLKPRFKSTGMEKFGHMIYDKNQELLLAHPEISTFELKQPFSKLYHELTRFIR